MLCLICGVFNKFDIAMCVVWDALICEFRNFSIGWLSLFIFLCGAFLLFDVLEKVVIYIFSYSYIRSVKKL